MATSNPNETLQENQQIDILTAHTPQQTPRLPDPFADLTPEINPRNVNTIQPTLDASTHSSQHSHSSHHSNSTPVGSEGGHDYGDLNDDDITFGLDRLTNDEQFLGIYLEIRDLCSRFRNFSLELVDPTDRENRSAWLSGVVGAIGVERSGDLFMAEDFYKAIAIARESCEEEERTSKQRELRQLLEDERKRWDREREPPQDLLYSRLVDSQAERERDFLRRQTTSLQNEVGH